MRIAQQITLANKRRINNKVNMAELDLSAPTLLVADGWSTIKITATKNMAYFFHRSSTPIKNNINHLNYRFFLCEIL